MTAPTPPTTPRVLVLGAANMDIAASSPHRLEAGDSTPGTIRHAPGGVARNVAENLGRLGHAVALLAPVGDDLFGRSLLAGTQQAGVDVQACWVLPDAATSTYLSLHGPDGDMQVAVNDMGIVDRLTPEHLRTRATLLAQADTWMLDGNLSPALLEWLFGEAGSIPVFVDPVSAFKCRRFLPWLARIHTLKLNRLEAEALWGRALDTDAAITGCAHWLHAQGVRQVVLSLGVRGAYGSVADGASAWAAALPVPVCNATGAGDALMAGLLHGHRRGFDLSEALGFATGCAALTVMAPQANHPGLSVQAVHQLRQRHAPP
ncbi:MAG: hypothetical protein JNM97_12060 [Rhodoferax sp.]|nr:hypothetical protein [Rhodoferax sp.]